MKPKTILHIEDDDALRELIARETAKTYSYIGVEQAEAAEEILERDDVGIIVLDLALPRMNGFEFLEKNHHVISQKSIPVIITTGLESDHLKVLCKKFGCLSMHKKPLNIKRLLADISACLTPSHIQG